LLWDTSGSSELIQASCLGIIRTENIPFVQLGEFPVKSE